MDTNISETSPRPFGEIFGLWLKVFKMDEVFFASEAPRKSTGNVLLALLIYAVVAVIVEYIQLLVTPALPFRAKLR